MSDLTQIFVILNVTVLGITVLLSCIYTIVIIVISRLHSPTNILTGNFCFLGNICAIFWMVVTLMTASYPTIMNESPIGCFITNAVSTIVNGWLLYALVAITFNRYLHIIYSNVHIFKRNICSVIFCITQWIGVVILCIPILIVTDQTCHIGKNEPFSIRLYTFFVLIVSPSVLTSVLNLLILINVQASTHRIRALNSASNNQLKKRGNAHARDTYLLKHMLFIFIVTVIGWTPVYVLGLLENEDALSEWIPSIARILPVFSSLINILDLFWYNHELRQYISEKCVKLVRLRRL